MEPATILHQLIHSEDLPREALRAAGERRTEMVHLFLEEIERWASDEAPADNNLLFFAFHLLASWKEPSAYRPLARLLGCPPDRVDAALGWITTETSHRVMAAVFDGDPAPLYNIILDENADEFVRSRMCETLAMLVAQGQLDRAEAAAFLRDCWLNLRPRQACFVWHGWQSAIAMLGLVELREIVQEAFKRRLIDPSWLAYEDFESDLALALLGSAEPSPCSGGEYTLFGDTIEELSTWYCFSEEAKRARERARNAPLLPLFAFNEPIINPMRGVGRNDPCPCGSGKKYKRCCLQ